MQQRNKGFTLVELLAVIVILAIIMIIAIPSVLDTLQTSRIKSFSIYGQKVITTTEKAHYEKELKQQATSGGIYVYDIKSDLGLSSTGNYGGYTVVDTCTSSGDIYLYLNDGTLMVYDYSNAGNISITDYSTFGDYKETTWDEKASGKSKAAASVIELTGGYECAVYGSGSDETIDVNDDVAGGTTNSNSAVFLDGTSVDIAMLTLAGNTTFARRTSGDHSHVSNTTATKDSKITDLVDKNIKAISKASSITDERKETAQIVSTAESPNPIYMWFDSGTIYWYTDATMVYANKDATQMFSWLGAVTTIDVSAINFNQTTSIEGLFSYDIGITSLNVSSMNVRNVTNMSAAFYSLINLKSINLSSWNTSKVKDMTSMFTGCSSLTTLDLSSWNTSNVENMGTMFSNCTKLVAINLSTWNTSKVKSLYGTFYNCPALKSVDVSNWNVSNVEDISYLFSNCNSLTNIDVSNWDTSNVRNMEAVFDGCKSLISLNLSKWNVSNVSNFYAMFYECASLTTLDLSTWHTPSATNMGYMFRYCENMVSLDVSNFDVSNVSDMDYMFQRMYKLKSLDLSKWTIKSGVKTQSIFNYDRELETIYTSQSWADKVVVNMQSNNALFYDDKKLVGGNGTKYTASYDYSISKAIIDGENGKSGYFTYKAKSNR